MSSKILNLPQDELDRNCVVMGDDLSLIKPGIYDLGFEYYETSLMFGRAPKITLWFRVLETGLYETVLPRYYNALKLNGKPRKNGQFKIGRRSDFLFEFCKLFPDYRPKRLDRMPLSRYREVIIKGSVATVTNNYKQLKIPDALQYSVINQLLQVK